LLTGSPSHCGREQDNPFEEADDFYRDRWSHDKVVRSTHGVNCTGSCIRYTSGALRLLARTHGVLLSVGRTGRVPGGTVVQARLMQDGCHG
jgi:hypothetical protein